MGARPKGNLELYKYIGSQIKKARVANKEGHRIMSQSKLADAIGVTFQQIKKYEKGTNGVSSNRLMQLSQFLKVPII